MAMSKARAVSAALLIGSVAAASRSAPPTRVDVFAPNEGDIVFPCYRQPALIAANANGTHLLAFAEGRVGYTPGAGGTCAPALQSKSDAAAPREVGGLLVRSSTDAGATWSSPRFLFGEASAAGPNIDFYVAVRDSISGRLTLVLQHEPDTTMIFTSDDEGDTWSEGTEMAVPTPPSPFVSKGPAVGHGLQIVGNRCAGDGGCVEAGRLVLPFYCENTSTHSGGPLQKSHDFHSCLLLSDDSGASWTWGGFGQSGSREAQVVQRASAGSSAALYVNERNFGATPGHRFVAASVDGGQTLQDYDTDPSLTEPVTAHWTGVVSSIVQPGSGSVSTVIYSGPASLDERSRMTLQVSYDEGASWAKSRVLWEGDASYSDLAAVPGGVGIIFENGDATFADRISFSNVPLTWIEESDEVQV